jgi:hypothetical protein
MGEWTATKVSGKTAIEVDGMIWRGSRFFSGPDNADLDCSGIFGQSVFERDGYRIVASVVPDNDPSLRASIAYYPDYPIDTQFVGITVSAYRVGIELGNASLWGIDDSSEDSYLCEITRELTDDAIAEANASLAALCEGAS